MSFDIATFESTVIEEANASEIIPMPECKEEAMIEGYQIRFFNRSTSKDEKPEEVSLEQLTQNEVIPILVVNWLFTNPNEELLKTFGREGQVKTKQDIWLEIDEDGSIATGVNKNVGLGKLREALGQNKSGKKWNLTMLNGAGPVKIEIKHVPSKKDPDTVYSRVQLPKQ